VHEEEVLIKFFRTFITGASSVAFSSFHINHQPLPHQNQEGT